MPVCSLEGAVMTLPNTGLDVFSGNGGLQLNYDYPSITGGITLTFSSVELASIDKPLANGGVATDRLYDVGQVIGTRHADILRGSQ